MKHTDPPARPSKNNSWQMLGVLELPVSSIDGSDAAGWLSRTLEPLNLRADTQEKILAAAQSAALRAEQNEPGKQTTRLRVFIPLKHAVEGKNWGFFLIEKIDAGEPSRPLSNREIELFLYQEGL